METYILTKEEAQFRSELVSNVTTQLFLILNDGESFLGALCSTFTLSSVQPLWFDYKGKSVLSVTVNDVTEEVDYKSCRVALKNLQIGHNSVKIAFESLYSHDGMGLHSLIDPADNEVYLYSQFETFGANRVFPCFDQPDLKSTFEFSVVAKNIWKVISNTSLKFPIATIPETNTLTPSKEEFFKEFIEKSTFPFGDTPETLSQLGLAGYQIHHFAPTLRISTYLAALCAGPYFHSEVDYKYPLGFYCRKSMQKFLDTDLYKTWTIAGFEFYESYFDYPYPFGKYDQVFVPEFNFVAMENVGCVTLDDKFLFENGRSHNKLIRACIIMLHEMSHMWFGDLVTMKWWDDLWLNESFATYISVLCTSRALGKTFPEAWIWFYTKIRHALSLDQQSTTHPIFCNIRHSIEIFAFFDAITYEKGSSVLKQLSFLIGEERFQLALRQYFKNNAFGNATFESLIGEIEKQVNEIDMSDWGQKWIKTAGVNEIVSEVERNDEGMIVAFRLKQHPAVKELDITRLHCFNVAIFNKELKLVYEKRIQGSEFSQELCEGKGEILFLDLGQNDFIKPGVDEVSFNHLMRDLNKMEDPLTRIQVYGLFLDRLMDKKLLLSQYFEFALENLSSETELFNIIFLVRGNCEVFKLVNYNQGVVEDISKKTVKILLDKKQNADIQTQRSLLKLILKVLYNPSDILEAVTWLETQTLSQGIRWLILKKYSSLSLSAKPLVEAEFLKDRSHSSHLHYSYCSAAYPDISTKTSVWSKLLSSPSSFSKFERIEIMKGFNQIYQKDLLKPFAYQYFHQLLRIIDTTDFSFSEDFLVHLLPKHLDPEELKTHLSLLVNEVPPTRNELKVHLQQALDLLTSLLPLP